MTAKTLSLLSLAAVLSLSACKKQVEPEAAAASLQEPAQAKAQTAEEAAQQLKENFSRVHFDFDSSSLDGVSRKALYMNAKLMQAHPTISVEVEGHCDERGTTDYNMALGQRRAQAVHDYLVSQGVAPSRLSAVSYGEEAPLEAGADEGAFSQNRRAEFVVTINDGLVDGTVAR